MNKTGKNKMITLDTLQIAQIEALAAFLSVQKIADYLNICENSFFKIRNRQPEVDEAYRRGVAKAHAFAGLTLLSFIKGKENTATKLDATKFYLRHQAGWSDRHDINLSNDDGSLKAPSPILISFIDGSK